MIYEAFSRADLVVVAWGVTGGNTTFKRRVESVRALIQPLRRQLKCLGKNGEGSPKQPQGSNRVDSVQSLTPWL